MAENLIEYRHVRKSFGSQVVLEDVNLTIEQGLVTTIVGRSGVGKSVLLKHAVGLLKPDRGEVLWHGRNILKLHGEERREMKRKLGYMFQSLALFDSMTVFENVAMPLEEKTRLGKQEIRKQALSLLDQLDLGNISAKYPSQISGGMRKRVALARALISKPEVIFFDEPTTGLDPIRRNGVHNMIDRYRRTFDFTAVLVSHDIPEVFSISQQMAMLEGGRILFQGTPEAMQKSADPLIRQFIEGREESPAAA